MSNRSDIPVTGSVLYGPEIWEETARAHIPLFPPQTLGLSAVCFVSCTSQMRSKALNAVGVK